MGGAQFQSPSMGGAQFQSPSVGGAQFQLPSVDGTQFQAGFSFSANPSTGGVVKSGISFAAGTGKPRSTAQARRRTKK